MTTEYLQAWYDRWLAEHRSTDLLHVSHNNRGEANLAQVHFVRDTLAGVVWAGVPHKERPSEPPPRSDCKVSARVVGEHTSKSVRLPVYSLERPDLGLLFTFVWLLKRALR